MLKLYEHHPDLFLKAKAFEDAKKADNPGLYKQVGWNLDMLLEDMIKPENIKKIKTNYQREKKLKNKPFLKLINSVDYI